MNSMLFTLTASLLVPVKIALSFFFLLRGHNMPGGGFIGGLIAALAYVLARLANSSPIFTEKLGESSLYLITAGWFIMLISFMPGILIENTAMLAIWGSEFSLPIVGKIKLGTVLLFDLGVYLAVIGALVKIAYVAIEKD